MNSLISPKSDKKRSRIRHLLSQRISVCSRRSPYSVDNSSNSAFDVLCCLALEQMLFMIFTTGVITCSKLITFVHKACWWMMQWQCKMFGNSVSPVQWAMNPVCRQIIAGAPSVVTLIPGFPAASFSPPKTPSPHYRCQLPSYLSLGAVVSKVLLWRNH